MDTIIVMKAFAAVARHRSFTRGAMALGLSVKVTSKYVAQLEAKLQVQLLTRTTRKVTLTEMGIAYLERCLPLLEQFDELESVVQEKQSDLAGLIRINAPRRDPELALSRQGLVPLRRISESINPGGRLRDRSGGLL